MAYADPNYDPKAAHEYYMKHRKLKGRRKKGVQQSSGGGPSGATNIPASSNYELTDAAKESMRRTDRVSTAGLNDAGKAAAKNVKANLQAERKKKADVITARAKEMISALRESLKGMSKEEKAANKERIKQQIESIRNDVKTAKESLKQEYDDKYVAELGKIKMTASFQNERSLAGMTEDGKAKAKALKENMMQRRREEQAKIAEDVKNKIAALRERFKTNRGMSDTVREQLKQKLKAEVDSLRAYAKEQKAKIKAKYDSEYQGGLSKLKQNKKLMRGVE